MAEIKWIKITTNIFDDEKIKLIEMLPERDSLIVIWFKLLTLAGKTNDNGFIYITKKMPITDEMLSTIFNRPLNTVRLALETFQTFEMIEIEDHINITNWEKHQNVEGMEKIRLQNLERQKKLRDKKKLLELENSNVTSRDSNATDKIRLDKIRLEEEKKKNIDIETFFCECWDLYPKKKGKGSISISKKTAIYNIGEEFERCIERYKHEIERDNTDMQFIKNGSTFFNSGYVDYLDENFEEEEELKADSDGLIQEPLKIAKGKYDNNSFD